MDPDVQVLNSKVKLPTVVSQTVGVTFQLWLDYFYKFDFGGILTFVLNCCLCLHVSPVRPKLNVSPFYSLAFVWIVLLVLLKVGN